MNTGTFKIFFISGLFNYTILTPFAHPILTLRPITFLNVGLGLILTSYKQLSVHLSLSYLCEITLLTTRCGINEMQMVIIVTTGNSTKKKKKQIKIYSNQLYKKHRKIQC